MVEKKKLVDILELIILDELTEINDDPFYKTKPMRKVSAKTNRDFARLMGRIEDHLQELFPNE